jgi:hypothetical protein
MEIPFCNAYPSRDSEAELSCSTCSVDQGLDSKPGHLLVTLEWRPVIGELCHCSRSGLGLDYRKVMTGGPASSSVPRKRITRDPNQKARYDLK